MLTALRRGSTSVARPLLSASRSTARVRSLLDNQTHHISLSITGRPSACRTFAVLSPWRQRASEAMAFEEEEDVVNEQATHASPPSARQDSQAAEYGPVTKFQELGDRRLVCKTVVDTLTRDMRLETMTDVQSLTINESLKGLDMYVIFPAPALGCFINLLYSDWRKHGQALAKRLLSSSPHFRTSLNTIHHLSVAAVSVAGVTRQTSEPS